MEHPDGSALEPGCRPLVTFQEAARISAGLGSQARLLARSLPPLATSRWQALPRLGRYVLGLGLGALTVWLAARLLLHRRAPPPPRPRPRRVRTTSASTYLAGTVSEASCSTTSRPTYNWAELQRASVSDQDSVVSGQTLVTDGSHLAPQQLGLMGMEALETVIGYWEDALGAYSPSTRQLVLTTAEEAKFVRSVEEILEAAYGLQETSEALFIHQNSVLNRRAVKHAASRPASVAEERSGAGRAAARSRSLLSVSTLEEVSFVSAQDTVADLRDFEELGEAPEPALLPLYQAALALQRAEGVPYRVLRTEFLRCSSDEEYLAKLHCLRAAFDLAMADQENRDWWVASGRLILCQLLVRADKEPKEFVEAFQDMLEFCQEEGAGAQMEEELRSRNVRCINFYDICLDYILIDSFEDLESPPSSVLAVMKNRWLSNSFKESALQTAIWSVFQAKRRLLTYPDGFKAKFYNVSEILTPALAWAFFGPDEQLADMVHSFKEQVLGFLTDIFSFQCSDFTSVTSLSASVMGLARTRLETIQAKLGCADLTLPS